MLIWTFETQVMAKRRVGTQVVNLTIDQKKSGIDPIYLSTDGVQHIIEKLLTRATTLLQTASRSEICSQSYGAPKSREVPTWAISGLPLGSLGTKNHLDVGPVERCKVYYKGEGGGFPQVRAMVSFVCPCCSWLVLAPKVLQLCINHFVWVLCRPMWVSEACQLFLVPSRSSDTPFYPSKCCELGNVPRLFLLPLFSTWIHIWVFQGVRSASNINHVRTKLLIDMRAKCFYNIINLNINSNTYKWKCIKKWCKM